MKMSLHHLLAAFTMAATVTGAATAQEKKLTREQLPSAVAATVDREIQGATIKGFATEREHGNKVYEAETIVNGHKGEVQVGPGGEKLAHEQ